MAPPPPETLLLQVEVRNGRYFPPARGRRVALQAKVHTSVLRTDAVPLTVAPVWNTLLEWRLPRSRLDLMRRHKTPVKLLVHSLDDAGRTSVLGFCMLDLRKAERNPPGFEWVGVESTRQHRKPELKMRVGLVPTGDDDDDDDANEDKAGGGGDGDDGSDYGGDSFEDDDAGAAAARPAAATAADADASADDSVSSGASHDDDAAGAGAPPSPAPASAAAARDDADDDAIALGSGHDVFELEVTIGEPQGCMAAIAGEDDEAYLAFDVFGHEVRTAAVPAARERELHAVRASFRLRGSQHELERALSEALGDVRVRLMTTAEPGRAAATADEPLPFAALLARGGDVVVTVPLAGGRFCARVVLNGEHITWPASADGAPASTSTSPAPAPAAAADADALRRFRVSVDLRSLHDLDEAGHDGPVYVYLSYACPVFGLEHAVTTAPPCEVRRGARETLVPHAYSLFEFAARPSELYARLAAAPLLIDVWQKERAGGDVRIGTASVRVSDALTAPGGVRGFDRRVAIGAFRGSGVTRVGALRVIVTLEQLEPLSTRDAARLPASRAPESGASAGAAPPAGAGRGAPYQWSSPPPRAAGAVGDAALEHELAVAWELELWRRDEEARWRAGLEAREAAAMDALRAEWKARELERQEEFARARDTAAALEAQLREKLADLERRDRELVSALEDSARERDAARDEQARVQGEAAQQVRQAQETLAHREALAKERQQLAEAARRSAEKEAAVWQRRAKTAEDALEEFRERHNPAAALELQERLAAASGREASLRRQLEEALLEASSFRTEWQRAVAENEAIRQRAVAEAEEALRARAMALEVQHVQELAQANARQTAAEDSELREIRQRLDRVGDDEARREQQQQQHHQQQQQHEPERRAAPDSARSTASSAASVQHMRQQRDELLATGLYAEDDAVIAALDRRIAEAGE